QNPYTMPTPLDPPVWFPHKPAHALRHALAFVLLEQGDYLDIFRPTISASSRQKATWLRDWLHSGQQCQAPIHVPPETDRAYHPTPLMGTHPTRQPSPHPNLK